MAANRIGILIDAVSATTTDHVKELNQMLYVGRTLISQKPQCRFLSIIPNLNGGLFKKTVAGAETLQVSTLTFVGTANAVNYKWYITQYNPVTQNFYNKVYSIPTPATGTITATTIGVQAYNIMRADPQLHATITKAAGVVTITATTGYAIFTIGLIALGGGLTQATTTAGVYPAGLTPYTFATNYGLVFGTDFTGSTAGYTYYELSYYGTMSPVINAQVEERIDLMFGVNLDDADGAALVTAIDAIFAQAAFNTQTVKVA